MKQPTIGRIVHYALPIGHRSHTNRDATSHEVAAIITRVWGAGGCVQLTPFVDLANDFSVLPENCSSVQYDPTGLTPRSWHWPEDAQPAPLGAEDEPAAPALAKMAVE